MEGYLLSVYRGFRPWTFRTHEIHQVMRLVPKVFKGDVVSTILHLQLPLYRVSWNNNRLLRVQDLMSLFSAWGSFEPTVWGNPGVLSASFGNVRGLYT